MIPFANIFQMVWNHQLEKFLQICRELEDEGLET